MSQTESHEPLFSASDALFSGAAKPLDVLKRVYGYPAFRGKRQRKS